MKRGRNEWISAQPLPFTRRKATEEEVESCSYSRRNVERLNGAYLEEEK
jgi:hypothetical protein